MITLDDDDLQPKSAGHHREKSAQSLQRDIELSLFFLDDIESNRDLSQAMRSLTFLSTFSSTWNELTPWEYF